MLEKYHKQKIDKKIRKKYQAINEEFKLGYNVKSDQDLIKLSIFETALRQKKRLESLYEKVRNSLFDMWDHLNFYERNDLIRLELEMVVNNFRSFKFENTKILIPFFDPLLNKLYVEEIAILELPQFLNLYYDFSQRLIPIEYYGLEIYKNGFSMMREMSYNEDEVVLYYNPLHIFYKVSRNEFKRYPIDIKAELKERDIEILSELLLKDEREFIDYLVDNKWVKKRFIKRRKKNEDK